MTQQPVQPTAPADEDIEETGVSIPWWTYVVIVAAVIILGAGTWLIIRRRKATKIEA
jgi:LPXTG-motif cell wall-anchored protein